MGSYHKYESVEVDKLEGNKHADEPEVMFGAKPAEMQYFVQNDAALDECQCYESLFLLRPSSKATLHLIETAITARILLLNLSYLPYLLGVLVLVRLLHTLITKQITKRESG